jgi:hypothetical protein
MYIETGMVIIMIELAFWAWLLRKLYIRKSRKKSIWDEEP